MNESVRKLQHNNKLMYGAVQKSSPPKKDQGADTIPPSKITGFFFTQTPQKQQRSKGVDALTSQKRLL